MYILYLSPIGSHDLQVVRAPYRPSTAEWSSAWIALNWPSAMRCRASLGCSWVSQARPWRAEAQLVTLVTLVGYDVYDVAKSMIKLTSWVSWACFIPFYTHRNGDLVDGLLLGLPLNSYDELLAA